MGRERDDPTGPPTGALAAESFVVWVRRLATPTYAAGQASPSRVRIGPPKSYTQGGYQSKTFSLYCRRLPAHPMTAPPNSKGSKRTIHPALFARLNRRQDPGKRAIGSAHHCRLVMQVGADGRHS
jgi:hypothetical protein